MEKRFKLFVKEFEYWIHDHEAKRNYDYTLLDFYDLCHLLNAQDEKIKELKSELYFKNNIIWDENDKAILCGDCYCLNNDVRKLVEENQQLKQALNGKAVEVLEKLLNKYNYFQNAYCDTFVEAPKDGMPLLQYIIHLIAELRGGKND